MEPIEIHGSATIEWMYPDIYGGADYLTIGLCHVRAADSLRIHYDSARDGWVIEQASRFGWAATEEPDSDWQEVAFVEAWARAETEEEERARIEAHE